MLDTEFKCDGIERISYIRKYCDYLENHLNNIEKAYAYLSDVLKFEDVLWSSDSKIYIEDMLKEHDLSKLSAEEFIPYVDYFHTPLGIKYDIWDDGGKGNWKHYKITSAFDIAVQHHYANNPHHPENWSEVEKETESSEMICNLFCLLVDWMAMSYVNNNTPEQYYMSHREKIKLTSWMEKRLMKWFQMIKDYNCNN